MTTDKLPCRVRSRANPLVSILLSPSLLDYIFPGNFCCQFIRYKGEIRGLSRGDLKQGTPPVNAN
jgi:hypothetical protein